MFKRRSLEGLLAQAIEQEKRYDWTASVNSYRKALLLAVESKDFLRAGKIQERVGYCLHRGAFQTETQEHFKSRLLEAMGAYDRARGFYEKMTDARAQKIARIFRCGAIMKYLGYWLSSVPSEKRTLLDECLKLEGKSLAVFLASDDMLEYGRTYNELWSVPLFRATLEWGKHAKKSIIEKGLKWGEKAVAALSQLGNTHELAKSYHALSLCLEEIGVFMADPEAQEKIRSKILQYLNEAIGFSEEIGDDCLSGKSHQLCALQLESSEEAERHWWKALECAKRTRDNLHIALSLQGLAWLASGKSYEEEDPERWRELREKSLKFYDKAQHHYSIISLFSPRHGLMSPPSGRLEHYLVLTERETNAEKRLDLLGKTEKAGVEALRLAEVSEDQEHISYALSLGAWSLVARSRMESDPAEKSKALAKALKDLEKATEILEQQQPFFYMNLGVKHTSLAKIKTELANIESRFGIKKRLLYEAVLHMEKGLMYLSKKLPIYEKSGFKFPYAPLRRDQDSYATILAQLYDLTKNPKHLRKSIEISHRAVSSAKKLDHESPIAESYWKIAKAQDVLREHLKAAESFERASESYVLAAEKIPQLGNFYSEYASYMKAWAEVEKSRHERENDNYAQSREHYRACSNHLERTERWSYLSTYYLAWSILEHGEELSRLDKPQDAMKTFSEARQTFANSVDSLRTKAGKLESSEERSEASKLAAIARLRRQYCQGRALMEEARLANKNGDRISSAEKYASATRLFEEIAPNFDKEEAREELEFAATLCQAWEKMELAEERRDAALYRKAARLFGKAGEISPRKTTRLTAIGNGCFCEALELGTKFMATSNLDFYSNAKLRMENAADYYRRAGFEKPALWVEATKRLFDAHVYAGKAEAEAEPQKRAKFYRMAEKCLELSAKLHGKAGYPDRRKEAFLSLERVRRERKLALSLTEVLTAPPFLSSTTQVAMPDSTENAAGLNDFESAYVKARLSVPDEFVPGEEFQVRLDLVNVGKKPGLLVRVEGLAPRKCKILKVPTSCVLEDDALNMQGRRLSPLSVESISVWVQVEDLIGINLSPRVVYVDELGNFKTAMIEGTKMLPVVKFESRVAHTIFSYLVDGYVEDSVKRRLGVEQSGWRSFPQIMRGAGASKKSLYGAGGRLGYGLSELRRKRLVDVKTFRGRGRGGHILRVRIQDKKAVVRRYVKEKAPDLCL